jgi:hypothetical protein
MSTWLTVYCARPVAPRAADELSDFLRAADLHTAAEALGLDDESVVDAALELLRVIDATGDGRVDGAASNAPRLRVHYADNPASDVLIHVWSDAPGVQTERDEALEELDEAHAAADRVRSHLSRTVDVVGIELPWSAGDMGFLFAVQSAEYFARAADGLLRDQDDAWWALADDVLIRLE